MATSLCTLESCSDAGLPEDQRPMGHGEASASQFPTLRYKSGMQGMTMPQVSPSHGSLPSRC